ncbi:MAG TPA: hypothetical protein VFQ43_19355, partial [Nitrososphaera sp.]|nr:hypothetical protein [Nitrososphaera sp.]
PRWNVGQLHVGQLEDAEDALFHLQCPVVLSNCPWKSGPVLSQAMLIASRMESASTMNLEGLRSLCRLNVTM